MSFRCTNLKPVHALYYIYMLNIGEFFVNLLRSGETVLKTSSWYSFMAYYTNTSSVIPEINAMSIFEEDLYSILFQLLSWNMKFEIKYEIFNRINFGSKNNAYLIFFSTVGR